MTKIIDTIPKENAFLRSSIIVLCVITVLGLGSLIYVLYMHWKELDAWKNLQTSNRIEDYEAYLEAFPEGGHVEYVRDQYYELQEELSDWKRIAGTTSSFAFIDFLQKHPNSIYQERAKEMIDSIMWDEALQGEGSYGYANYITNVPYGKHIRQARELYEEKELQTLHDDEIKAAKETLYRFYQSISLRDEEGLLKTVTNSLVFRGKEANKSQVLSYMNSLYAEDVYKLTLNLSEIVVEKDVGENREVRYFIKFTLDMHMERENPSKETYSNNEGVVILNNKYKIEYYTIRRIAGY